MPLIIWFQRKLRPYLPYSHAFRVHWHGEPWEAATIGSSRWLSGSFTAPTCSRKLYRSPVVSWWEESSYRYWVFAAGCRSHRPPSGCHPVAAAFLSKIAGQLARNLWRYLSVLLLAIASFWRCLNRLPMGTSEPLVDFVHLECKGWLKAVAIWLFVCLILLS